MRRWNNIAEQWFGSYKIALLRDVSSTVIPRAVHAVAAVVPGSCRGNGVEKRVELTEPFPRPERGERLLQTRERSIDLRHRVLRHFLRHFAAELLPGNPVAGVLSAAREITDPSLKRD